MRDAFKTIVGGRSTDNLPAGNSRRGIEILLKKASVDEDFAKVLVAIAGGCRPTHLPGSPGFGKADSGEHAQQGHSRP